MKRILAITLTLVMLLAVLTGCMASRKPSGDEGEQNPSGKRLPITLTIAETLPSCVAFEHKDEKPYCFYAYDKSRMRMNNEPFIISVSKNRAELLKYMPFGGCCFSVYIFIRKKL